MEKDNITENQIKNEVEEVNTETSNAEILENTEGEILESNDKKSSGKVILANALDQLLIVAGSSLLLLICDLILKIFGYMFVRDNGSLVLAGGIIYFIINCIYIPIMESSKLNGTIAKKILNIN